MDILDDMGVSKLSAKVFGKVNYSVNTAHCIVIIKGATLKLSSSQAKAINTF